MSEVRSNESDSKLSAEESELGMDREITRRDFLNTAALGYGTALLTALAPGVAKAKVATQSVPKAAPWHPWTGYGGVGDYAKSNGNTWDVVNAGHGIRDGLYGSEVAKASPTGETYDLVIVGGGFAGTIAAYTFLKETRRQRPCLILDNHPLIGGEAKRNEFFVRGQRLIGPQGSNGTFVPVTGWGGELWRDVGLPTRFEFAQLPVGRRHMEFQRSNYEFYGELYDPADKPAQNHGYFFDSPRPHWVTNPWAHKLEGTPWPDEVRRELLRWVNESVPEFNGSEEQLERWLDTMTYEDYLTKFRGLHPEVARFVDPIIASSEGLGSDALSACLAYHGIFPGFKGLSRRFGEQIVAGLGGAAAIRTSDKPDEPSGLSLPGGNDGIMRAIVKWLNPEVIEGSASFSDVHNGRIRFEAMDTPGTPCRMRAGATVVCVAHDAESQCTGQPATITYLENGQFRSVQARTVIWAAASWSGKHAIQNLPTEYRAATEGFPRSPMLCVNVALNNWRALYKLGYSTCSWRGGFGFTANIRRPVHIGDYRPPLDPDLPTLFTFYVPFPQRGLPLVEQGRVARAKLYATSYREFETQIRRQMVTLFASAGFDPKRDIAGIVINRWGHAYANAGPGFFYGLDGKPAPRDVLRRPTGNLTFAHTELAGIAAWWNAGQEGIRAAHQVLAML
jgi:spermidine dehydrogenase